MPLQPWNANCEPKGGELWLTQVHQTPKWVYTLLISFLGLLYTEKPTCGFSWEKGDFQYTENCNQLHEWWISKNTGFHTWAGYTGFWPGTCMLKRAHVQKSWDVPQAPWSPGDRSNPLDNMHNRGETAAPSWLFQHLSKTGMKDLKTKDLYQVCLIQCPGISAKFLPFREFHYDCCHAHRQAGDIPRLKRIASTSGRDIQLSTVRGGPLSCDRPLPSVASRFLLRMETVKTSSYLWMR